MDLQQPTHVWRFWGAWMLAFLAFPVAGLVGSAVAGPLTTPLDGVLGGVAAGAVIGSSVEVRPQHEGHQRQAGSEDGGVEGRGIVDAQRAGLPM